ncbi:MAG: hypothetical protein D6693_11105 [Planctomycetota bacterium]|nr:MAG: hypothetical protein D6693_11105 [Planctomycetota bacterium]
MIRPRTLSASRDEIGGDFGPIGARLIAAARAAAAMHMAQCADDARRRARQPGALRPRRAAPRRSDTAGGAR